MTAYERALGEAKLFFRVDDKVWLEPIHDSKGIGLFVEREGIKVCFQLKSVVTVGGRKMLNDIAEHGAKLEESLNQGFTNMEKSLEFMIKKQGDAVKFNMRPTLWQRIKGWFL